MPDTPSPPRRNDMCRVTYDAHEATEKGCRAVRENLVVHRVYSPWSQCTEDPCIAREGGEAFDEMGWETMHLGLEKERGFQS